MRYIDVAKGILMLIVVYYHVLCISQAECIGINNPSTIYLFHTPDLFRPFFMAGFFVINGVTFNLKRCGIELLKRDLKAMVLPMVLICTMTAFFVPNAVDHSELSIPKNLILYGGGAWFVASLFIARQLYLHIARISRVSIRITLLLLLSLIGCLSIGRVFDFWYWEEALIFIPFLELGRHIKKIKGGWYIYSTCIYLSMLIFCLAVFKMTPFMTSSTHCGIKSLPVFWIMAATGSLLTIKVSMIVNTNKLLEYVGRNSLIFYLTHMTFLWVICRLIADKYSLQGIGICNAILLVVTLFVLAALWSYFWSLLLNTKYLRWIIGKF